ncbi:alpha/beta fold hydrolase [Microbispora sp. RL4-1S]|uniref:Alpha/beta fold hydrolase n=1 Tax=Microbispora oryzae TaxID=2806554 RepID=A0A940WKV4_9ACTN|nr:alpha/beta fold hydrolase [Microbispora oryzae]MBP2702981.1 alpha/beta fold hydrolase [Microbispora oryzae]
MSGASPARTVTGVPSPIRWAEASDGSERARLPVPVDHRDPDGPAIDLALVRHPAAEPGARLGALVVAPDDPGSSGIAVAGELRKALPPSVTARFDLIGFDHRFSGESAPLQWGLDQREIFWVFHQSGSFAAEVRFQAEIAAKAAGPSLAVLPHITTRNIARDIDIIRRALGEERISLLGHNYGSYVAAVYSQMFGSHADRVILDSVLSPDWVWSGLFRNFARNCEETLRWWCARTARPGGPLGDTPERVRDAFEEVLRKAGAGGIMLAGVPVPLDDQFLRVLAMLLLSSARSHAALEDVVRSAATGAPPNPATLQLIGSMFAVPRDASTAAAQMAILCGDAAWPRALEEYESASEEAPGFMGRALLGVKAGAFWPAQPIEPPTAFGPTAAGGVLLVQAERDMFTASVGATRMRSLLGERSRLLMVRGMIEHRVFPFAGDAQVNEVAGEFLTTGRLPDADITLDDGLDDLDARALRGPR